jgi:type IV secretion system protein VirB9
MRRARLFGRHGNAARNGLIAALLLAAAPASSEITPSPTSGDSHIQSVAYDPQEVVVLHVAPGFATTVVFSPDERIETVTVGESSAWQVQANKRADQLVVKPLGNPSATNLTVISDQRSYAFLLTTSAPDFGVSPYLVRFTYPAMPLAQGEPAKVASGTKVYRLSGSRDLRPTAMSDDDQFTSIVWPADAAMPAVYAEQKRGKLALVNGVVRDGVFVIEGVYPKLVFLRGSERAQALRLDGEGTGQ